MAEATKAGTLLIQSTDTVGTEIAVSTSFPVKAVILFWSGRSEDTDAAGSADAHPGVGFASGPTARGAVTAAVEDGVSPSNTASYITTSACVAIQSPGAGGTLGLADLSSLTDGAGGEGFELIIDEQFSADRRISYLAIGGSDITDVDVGSFLLNNTTGSQAITGLGFQPDVVLLGSVQRTTDDDGAESDASLVFGAATAAAEEAVVSFKDRDGQATTVAHRYGFGAECAGTPRTNAATTMYSRAEFTSFGADGFTLNVLEAAVFVRHIYLAIKGGSWAVADDLTRTDTTQEGITGLGFQPNGLLVFSHGDGESTQDVQTNHGVLSIGAATGPTERTAQAVSNENGVGTSEGFTAIEHDAIYIHPDLADGVDGLMDLVSFDSDGFTFVMDDADPSAAFFAFLAMRVEDADGGGGEGYGFALGAGAALGLGVKGGEGEFTGLDGGLALAHGEKGGAAETRVRSGAWTAAVGEKHGEAYISGFDGPYLNADGAPFATIAGGIRSNRFGLALQLISRVPIIAWLTSIVLR